MKLVGLFLGLLLWSAWAMSASVQRKNDNDLTFELAQKRKEQVKSVSYELYFELAKNAKGYSGKSKMMLELSRVDQPLSVDFLGDKILAIKVNGKDLKKYQTRRGSFDLPANVLSEKTMVEIDFRSSYSKESGGFIRTVDPEDQAEYLYTDFEPYYAHHLFPCIDQPDLKARYTVSVKAPIDWKVIQNELVAKSNVEGEFAITVFQQTPPISPYLFFLGAGPFVEWKDQFNKTPLYLYARKSLEKYVDADAIFKTTKKGLKFFNNYFAFDYPFSKYGQVFIPDFAWGGMENPGAVTLNERNIFRGPVPESKMQKRNNLILHEMAHMWFGDLVTMQWWNDLWLNESFATYLASIAQERAMDSKSTWMDFYSTKTWGYWQDQLVTTHPIETNVPDVRTARGNFDGITYAKGASALKQLHFYVGEEGFREGLRNYFKKFAFKNTLRSDFIGSIGDAAKKDLSDWTNKWLQTAGPNRVSIDYQCMDRKITSAELTQKASVSGALSPHKVKLGLYRRDDDELDQYKVVDVTYEKEKTEIPHLVGERCPDFVLPNYQDLDYGIFVLDPNSLTNAELALKTLPDSLSKSMVWNILTQMVRDQELSPKEFFVLAMKGLESENDDLLLGNLLSIRHSTIRDQYLTYLTYEERAELAPTFEKILWTRMEKTKSASSLQMIFFDFYVTVAQTKEGVENLHKILTTNDGPKGLALDQDRRWLIVTTLAENNDLKAKELIEKELKQDGSTMGKRMAFAAKAAIPDKKLKSEYWKSFLKDKELNYSDFREAAGRIHNPNFVQLSGPFVNDYFAKVTKTDWSKHDDVVDIYFETLFPVNLCSADLLKLSQKQMKAAKKLTSLAKRSWMEAQDELNRCVNVRNYQRAMAKKF